MPKAERAVAPTNYPGFFVQRVASKARKARATLVAEPQRNAASGVLGGESDGPGVTAV